MIGEEEGSEISGKRDAKGNISEADAPGTDVLTELATKLATDPGFKLSIKTSIFRNLDFLYARTQLMKDFKNYKVNMVGKITATGFVSEITAVAIDGQKLTDLSILPQKPEYPAVAFVDLPLTVEVGYSGGQRMGVLSYSGKATFRNLPNKA